MTPPAGLTEAEQIIWVLQECIRKLQAPPRPTPTEARGVRPLTVVVTIKNDAQVSG